MDRSRDNTRRRIRDMIAVLRAEIATSRDLREMSQNLRQENADLRELLRENLLSCWSKREHWEDT